jgi:hypothetical protein
MPLMHLRLLRRSAVARRAPIRGGDARLSWPRRRSWRWCRDRCVGHGAHDLRHDLTVICGRGRRATGRVRRYLQEQYGATISCEIEPYAGGLPASATPKSR